MTPCCSPRPPSSSALPQTRATALLAFSLVYHSDEGLLVLRNDLQELGVGLADLLKHGGEHVGVLLDNCPDLVEHLVVPEEGEGTVSCARSAFSSSSSRNLRRDRSRVCGGGWSRSGRGGGGRVQSSRRLGDTRQQVLNGSVRVIEACSKGGLHLRLFVTHVHDILNSFVILLPYH